jgi:predicted nucleic acid-binding protein
MTLDDLQTGEAVFLDANVLTYYFQPHPVFGPSCQTLLDRLENQDLQGFTSTQVLGEMMHRLMTLEAITVFGWPFAGIGNRLRSNPAQVQKLILFRSAVEKVIKSRIQKLTITPDLLVRTAELCQNYGLLTNDGLIVAVMQAHGLTRVASGDADFDRVPGLVRYAPS